MRRIFLLLPQHLFAPLFLAFAVVVHLLILSLSLFARLQKRNKKEEKE